MYTTQSNAIQAVIASYFDGIYRGDTEQLRRLFHPQALLCGDIKGQPYFKKVEEYLEAVHNRQSPQSLGETLQMSIIGIEVLGNNAIAKLHVPMLGYNYYDYLSLSVIGGEWLVVNKMFTHQEPAVR